VAGTEAEYKVIARTFLSVYPEATAWVDGTLLVGGPDRLWLNRQRFERKLETPNRLATLEAMRIASFEDLLRLYRAGAAELRRYVGSGPILTDDRPLVEYFLSLPRDRELDLTGVAGDVGRHVRLRRRQRRVTAIGSFVKWRPIWKRRKSWTAATSSGLDVRRSRRPPNGIGVYSTRNSLRSRNITAAPGTKDGPRWWLTWRPCEIGAAAAAAGGSSKSPSLNARASLRT
jgi:hypothetical protein